MAELKDGDIVYHKATRKRGVVAGRRDDLGELHIAWENGTKDWHTPAELWIEEEYKEKYPKKSRNIKVRFR
jgi:hypothetical protein